MYNLGNVLHAQVKSGRCELSLPVGPRTDHREIAESRCVLLQRVLAATFVAALVGVAQGQVASPVKMSGSAWPGLQLTRHEATVGSPYIPMDSWIYPAMARLAALGYVDSAFSGMRPWTRLNVANMLAETSDRLTDHADDSPGDEEAMAIYLSLAHEVNETVEKSADTGQFAQIDQVY